MCLVIFAWDAHPDYKLILAANRDEFFERAAATAAYWEDAPEVLGGRDLKSGGTWLGLNTQGKFTAITNYRDPTYRLANPPSRGSLTLNYLREQASPLSYLEQHESQFHQYDGFNLLVGSFQGMFHYSNREKKINRIKPGIYGLSNHLLDTPWPKVVRGKKKLEDLVFVDGWETEDLHNMMYDIHQPADSDLPYTGVSLKWERALGPMFIRTKDYGTCCSSVITMDREGNVSFSEKSFPPFSGTRINEVSHHFSLKGIV